MWVCFWIVYSVSLISMSVFMPVSYCFGQYSFVSNWNQNMWCFQLIYLTQSCFDSLVYFVVPDEFIFGGGGGGMPLGFGNIALNVYIPLDILDIFTIFFHLMVSFNLLKKKFSHPVFYSFWCTSLSSLYFLLFISILFFLVFILKCYYFFLDFLLNSFLLMYRNAAFLLLFLYHAAFTECAILRFSFESLEFLAYMNMSSANREDFTSSCQI